MHAALPALILAALLQGGTNDPGCDAETAAPNNAPWLAQWITGPTCGEVSPADTQDWYEAPLAHSPYLAESYVNITVESPGAAIGVQVWQTQYDIFGSPVGLKILASKWGSGGVRLMNVTCLAHQALFPSVHVRVLKIVGVTKDAYRVRAWQ